MVWKWVLRLLCLVLFCSCVYNTVVAVADVKDIVVKNVDAAVGTIQSWCLSIGGAVLSHTVAGWLGFDVSLLSLFPSSLLFSAFSFLFPSASPSPSSSASPFSSPSPPSSSPPSMLSAKDLDRSTVGYDVFALKLLVFDATRRVLRGIR